MEPTQYTIGELAQRTHVPVTTLRYYERAGLLRPNRRSRAGYRIYDDGAVLKVAAIRRAQEMGLSCREIRELLSFAANQTNPCAAAYRLCQAKLARLRNQIAILQTAARKLQRAGKTYTDDGSDRCCAILCRILAERKV